ncbi:putative two-component response regulator [Metapseudomonas resinovorans NBRC 106553]|uniref:Putative two-component response regulator n=1 Tax=Metapseudomonas resinovorans NBRC 106553 TaxID=1245471 RepID=S6B9V1_METRE|nr:putative two-component response regulator [Pseudomonas resinovorans NBRC 106553]
MLIADPDRWSAELLTELVRKARGDVQLEVLQDSASVLEHCRNGWPDLLIVDYGLPGIGGLELLREVRRQRRHPPVPFFLITARVDAASVRAALPLAPTAYLAKPFNADDLLQRLRNLLLEPGEEVPSQVPATASLGSLDAYLAEARESSAGAPLLKVVREALEQALEAHKRDLAELEPLLHQDPQLTGQLIAAANSAAQHLGSNCQTLGQALARLGPQHSLNLALGLTLQRSVSLIDPLLVPHGERIWRQAQRTADLARWLAQCLEGDSERCYTAGLLHLLGDLAVLRSIQSWRDLGGEGLTAEQVDDALREHAAPFGSALRTRWRLPLELRQLIAAAYQLGGGVYSRDALILHVAKLVAELPEGEDATQLAKHKAARMLDLDAAVLASLPKLAPSA